MVSLEKSQRITLTKSNGTGTLTQVRMALGWDTIKGPATTKKGIFGKPKTVDADEIEVDLDASAILYDTKGKKVDVVYFGQLFSKDGSLRHTGDNLTGAGDGDDESINVDLSAVPATVEQIVFVVNSFSGETFDQIENAFCRVVDSAAGDTELCRYELSGKQSVQAMVMAKLSREGNGWAFTAIGTPVKNGKSISQVEPAAQAAL